VRYCQWWGFGKCHQKARTSVLAPRCGRGDQSSGACCGVTTSVPARSGSA
jgi:hypothetical protein